MAENIELAVPSWTQENYTPVKNHRAKKYTLVVYPQDMPENWREILRETMWDIVISPLHDKDENPDKTPKKPHHHVLLSAGTAWITMQELAKIGEVLRGVAKPQQCSSPKGMVRYFIHIDNPDKKQYKKADIEVYGNYDIEEYFKATQGEERIIRQEIVAYVIENHVTELVDLIQYSIQNNERWDDYIASHTLYFSQLIRSLRHKGAKRTVDPETGEIK